MKIPPLLYAGGNTVEVGRPASVAPYRATEDNDRSGPITP